MAADPSFVLQKSAAVFAGTFSLLAVTAAGQAAPARQGDSLQSQLIARCERAVESGDLEGLVVVVQVEDTVLLGRGWGRLSGSELAAPDSLFHAEPLVEPLVVWTAMHLAEAGSLDVDSAIHELLPGPFPEDPWAKRPVEVQHLLNHTSGLFGWASALPGSGDPESDTQGADTQGTERTDASSLIRMVAELGLESEPGACFDYSESNGLVLGAIVEKVSGMSVPLAVQSHVIARLKLEDTGWLREVGAREGRDDDASREFAGQLVDAPEGVHPYAEDRFFSSAADLTALLRALGQGGIVRAQTLEQMLAARRLTGGAPIGAGYGLNFASIGEVDGFSIGGCAEGATIHVAHYPGVDVTVALLAACTGAPLIPLERDLTRLALGLALAGSTPVLLPPEDARKVAGSYQVGCTTLKVTVQKDGSVVLSSGGGGARPLGYRGALQFVARADGDVRFEFVVPEGEPHATVLRIDDHGRYSEAIRVL